MSGSIYTLVESVLSRFKGRKYVIDRRIPFHLFLMILLRRCAWLVRGSIRSFLLTGKPALVFMAPGVKLRNMRLCRLGRGVTLETGVILDALSYEGVSLGDNVTIGAYSEIRSSMLFSLGAGLRFGKNSACGAYSFIGAGGLIRIGDDVIMGQHVSFHAENHNFSRTDIPIRMQGVSKQGITVHDDCWVGANVTFLDGCQVGKGCVIAAGAVVRGEVQPFSVIAGVPAKVVRSRKPTESVQESLAALANQ